MGRCIGAVLVRDTKGTIAGTWTPPTASLVFFGQGWLLDLLDLVLISSEKKLAHAFASYPPLCNSSLGRIQYIQLPMYEYGTVLGEEIQRCGLLSVPTLRVLLLGTYFAWRHLAVLGSPCRLLRA